MDCEHALSHMFAYLDGEMTVWRRTAFVQHMDDCPPCKDGLDAEAVIYQRLRFVVSQKCAETAPDRLRARIADCLGIQVDPNLA
jgi:mycothiol system anti-sigma-R factor